MEIGPEKICKEDWIPEAAKQKIKEAQEVLWLNREKKLDEKIKNLPKEQQEQWRNEFEEFKKMMLITENGGALEMHKWSEEKRRRFEELQEKFRDILWGQIKK